MHNTFCSFPYHIENWPSSPILSKRSNIRRETSFHFSVDVDVCLLGQPSFAGKLLDWLYDVQENLTLQVWIQNCSDGELLSYKTQQFASTYFEKNIQPESEQPIGKGATKKTSKFFHKDDEDERKITAKIIVELREDAIYSTEQWENDINTLLKMVNPKQDWLASRVLNHEDYIEHLQEIVQQEMTKNTDLSKQDADIQEQSDRENSKNPSKKQRAIKQRINKKQKQTDVSQRPEEQSLLKDVPLNSSTLWNEGMILQVLEGNDDESEFNSRTLRQMLYMLTQRECPTAIVLSLAFSWKEKEEIKMPPYSRNIPPHHRRHMQMFIRRKRKYAHVPERNIRRRIVVLSQDSISSLFRQLVFRSIVGEGGATASWEDLTHDDIIHLLWSPSHIFGISEPTEEDVYLPDLLGALTTTTNGRRRRGDETPF